MSFTLNFFAPFYNRTGYGHGARSILQEWLQVGLRVRIVPVDDVDTGVDDFDMTKFKALEHTTIEGVAVAVFFHVPHPQWLKVQLPPGSLRVLMTTFDGAIQGAHPPAEWIRIANAMDRVYVADSEAAAWRAAGLEAHRVRTLTVPHGWMHAPCAGRNAYGGEQHTGAPSFRFLSIAMFQPRRRWDTLIEAFCQEFRHEPEVELLLKVNWPSWHPVAGQPQRDLQKLVADAIARHGCKARVTIDDSMGTRSELRQLIDSIHCYASADTVISAPISESLFRGKMVVAPVSVTAHLPTDSWFGIQETPGLQRPITPQDLQYQPHHRESFMPLLRVEDVRHALRAAFESPVTRTLQPWDGWSAFVDGQKTLARQWVQAFERDIRQLIAARPALEPGVLWEGSQFVYHSLAHVNRQICSRLIRDPSINLSIKPYEPDQFEPRQEMPAMAPLVERVHRELAEVKVHVRHQWPPRFDAPPQGAWVMIQPWEFGGIPQEWVSPMRDLVDEIWVPTNWVRQCYIDSGVPAEKVLVVPNGVDLSVYTPHGPQLELPTTKTFKFLFVGGTIHRKGIDVVLSAFVQAFSESDDVALVIKGQSGGTYAGSDLDRHLEAIRAERPDAPEIVYFADALSEPEMAALYRSCDALVMPYRGEGYGLPIAEAMASGLPVIVTAGGAADDFVRPEFARMVPAKKKRFTPDNLQPAAVGAWLLEPDVGAVVDAMQQFYASPDMARSMGRLGRDYAEANLSWDEPARLVRHRLQELSKQVPLRFRQPRTAFALDSGWDDDLWLEVLLSYITEFHPEEPVTLALKLGREPEQLSIEEATERISKVIESTKMLDFPEIRLITNADDAFDLFKDFNVQWLAPSSSPTLGLDGPFGYRMGAARLRYREASTNIAQATTHKKLVAMPE